MAPKGTYRATVVLIFSMCLSTAAKADLLEAGPSTVTSQSMITYTYMSGGDVVFQLTGNQVSKCDGFWLRATDAGFKNALAVLVSTVQAQRTLSVWADNSQIWIRIDRSLLPGLQLGAVKRDCAADRPRAES